MGLIAAGAFIRFGDEGFEGFLPVRRMRRLLDDERGGDHASRAGSSGGVLRLGDPMRVTVEGGHAAREGRSVPGGGGGLAPLGVAGGLGAYGGQ